MKGISVISKTTSELTSPMVNHAQRDAVVQTAFDIGRFHCLAHKLDTCNNRRNSYSLLRLRYWDTLCDGDPLSPTRPPVGPG